MRKRYWNRLSRVFLVFAVITGISFIPSIATASCASDQQTCSAGSLGGFGVTDTQFGSGSNVNQCSAGALGGYCANATVGDLGDGSEAPGSGNTYKANAGSGITTDRAPYLSFFVGGVSTDLGYLTAANGSIVNANFTVKTYLAGGFIVQVSAPPPTDTGGYKLSTPGSATTPSPGTEMFGMNLISNTTNPSGGATPFGANPQCSPDSTFCPSGAMTSSVTSNYNQTNKYYYPGSGTNYTGTIINSNTSTGSVSYTLSYVYEISGTTPAGLYTYNGMFVATSTY